MKTIEPWVAARILHFFNQAQSPKDIFDAPQLLSDTAGNNLIITLQLAEKILEVQDELPAHEFSRLEELAAIPGLSGAIIRDMAAIFRQPAAESFVRDMFQNVLLANWELEHYTTYFEDTAAFHEIADHPFIFTQWVAERIEHISYKKFGNQQAARLAARLLEKCYLERFPDTHYGSFAFAFWFYQFDADNWFTFEHVRKAAERYLGNCGTYEYRQELRLFKGFDNEGVVTNNITAKDLAVVANYAEEAITIWAARLKD